MSLRLNVEVAPGTPIEGAVREAHRLAVVLHVGVRITFNGERMLIHHDTDPAAVIRSFYAMTHPADTPALRK